jgi:CHAD domain-containing protein
VRERLAARKKLAGADDSVERVVGSLEEALARVESWPVDRNSFEVIRAGLRRAYERGRAERRAIVHEPSADRFHAWRKRVKLLWYHTRLLERIWRGPMRRAAAEMARLADFLGEDHDLALLRDLVVERGYAGSEALVALIEQRRAELQCDALHLGSLLYAERPGAFIRRMKRYWKASHARRARVLEDIISWRSRATAADAKRASA